MSKSKLDKLTSDEVSNLIEQIKPLLTDASKKQSYISNIERTFEAVVDSIKKLICNGATYKHIAEVMSQAQILKNASISISARQVKEFCKRRGISKDCNKKVNKTNNSETQELKREASTDKTGISNDAPADKTGISNNGVLKENESYLERRPDNSSIIKIKTL